MSTSKVVCGIDPDKKGALVFIKKEQDDSISIIDSYIMPLIHSKEVKGKKIKQTTEIDFDLIKTILKTRIIEQIVIEEQHIFTSSHQGNKSNETIMRNYGQFLGLFKALDLPFVEVHSLKWQKAYPKDIEIKEDLIELKLDYTKKRSITWARDLVPTINLYPSPKHRIPSPAIADATLIANYYYSWQEKNQEVAMNI